MTPELSDREILAGQILDALSERERQAVLVALLHDALRDAAVEAPASRWSVFDTLAWLVGAPHPHGVVA